MSELGQCPAGCAEARLDLVPADAFDRLAAGLARTREATDAFRAIAQPLATLRPAGEEIEAAYRAIQTQARTALRRHPDDSDDEPDWIRPADPTTSWWCPKCGGLDAPQPCIGVCIKRPAEWVRYEHYDQARDVALDELECERRLRRLARRVAFVTPRAGQWERGWEVAQAEAQGTIGSPPAG